MDPTIVLATMKIAAQIFTLQLEMGAMHNLTQIPLTKHNKLAPMKS